MTIYVVKKDGTTELWNVEKIVVAALKAAERSNAELNVSHLRERLNTINSAYLKRYALTMFGGDSVLAKDSYLIKTSDIHPLVIDVLKDINPDVANAYQEFRDYKNTYAKEFEKIKNLADGVLLLGDRENANFDSSLVSTKGSLIKGYLTKSLYNQFFLSKEEKTLIKRGDIYIHDLRDMLLDCINCCLFDMGNVLRDGFTMSNIRYTEPKSVMSALNVIGDITLVATAQQFGGFTIPEIDKILVPYCRKTYNKAMCYAQNELKMPLTYAYQYAEDTLARELRQGFQALELKLNTVPCSRGDFAFTTITFGYLDSENTDPVDARYQKMVCEALLNTRIRGHGGKRVVFPKLVYLYSIKEHRDNVEQQELFELALSCSSQCMYPDYLSIDGNLSVNAVARVFKESGGKVITSPMGCRAFLSPWRDPKTHEYVATGRCNIGAVSLNLPLIMAVAQRECKEKGIDDWHSHFWNLLDSRLETIRNFLKKRFERLKKVRACTNPMCFMEGGLYGGKLKADDTIEPLLEYMTASFGITALNEASIIYTGKSIREDNYFGKYVLDYIQNKVDHFKEEDNYLYALYGTPAESLCSTQAAQYAQYTGSTQFGKYFSNSFHCHVTEQLTPINKQLKELDSFHKCNGGHIQYIRLDNPKNIRALATIIEHGMELGFYQGVNFDAAYCEDCHRHSTNVRDSCPYCDSRNISVISRVCGYLGYSNINGTTRMNDGKMAEISERVSM